MGKYSYICGMKEREKKKTYFVYMKISLWLAIIFSVVTCLMFYRPSMAMVWTGGFAAVMWGVFSFTHAWLLNHLD